MSVWDRQRDENNKLESNLWFDRFTDFRLMGASRSLLACVNEEKTRKGQKKATYASASWRSASKKWNWRQRAEAWDELNRQERIKANEQARAEMLQRHIKLSRGLQTVGGKRLQQLDKAPQDLTGSEARQYIKDGVGLERQARGLPEHLLAIATMSNEEIERQYASLINAITPTGDAASGDETTGDTDPAGESKN